jgi:hypothetical protein
MALNNEPDRGAREGLERVEREASLHRCVPDDRRGARVLHEAPVVSYSVASAMDARALAQFPRATSHPVVRDQPKTGSAAVTPRLGSSTSGKRRVPGRRHE